MLEHQNSFFIRKFCLIEVKNLNTCVNKATVKNEKIGKGGRK